MVAEWKSSREKSNLSTKKLDCSEANVDGGCITHLTTARVNFLPCVPPSLGGTTVEDNGRLL